MAVKKDTVQSSIILDGKQAINQLGVLEMKYADIRRSMKGMKKDHQDYAKLAGDQRKVKAEIDSVRQKLGIQGMTLTQLIRYERDLRRERSNTTTKGTQQYAKLTAKLREANAAIRQQRMEARQLDTVWSRMSGGFKSSLAMFGPAGLASAAVFGVVQGFKNFVNTFKEFQSINSELAGILRVTTKETTRLQAQQLRLGKTTEFTSRQVAQAQIELARLGQEEQNIIKMTPGILAAATAMKVSLAEAAELVAGQLNAFNMEAEESGRVSDVLAKSTQISAFNFERLKTALAIVSPAAKASNVTLEQTLAILSAAIDANVDASSAGTALRNIFIDIKDKGLSLNEALSKIKNSQDKLTTANDLFGKRGAVVSSIIAENTDKIIANTEALNDAKGTAQEFADTQLDNLTGDLKLLSSAWEGLLLTVEKGDGVFGKALRTTVQLATEAVTALANLDLVFSTMFDSFDQLTDNELLRLLEVGMETDSGKGVLSFFKTLEELPMDKIISNVDRYKKAIVDALVAEGENREQASRIFDVWFADKQKQYDIVVASQTAYNHAISNGVTTFEDFTAKYGRQYQVVSNGQMKLIEIEKLYQKAIEDRQKTQNTPAVYKPTQAVDDPMEDFDFSWLDDPEALFEDIVPAWDQVMLQLKYNKGEFYQQLTEATTEYKDDFLESWDAMMEKDLESTIAFLENLKLREIATKQSMKVLYSSMGEIFGALANLQNDQTERGIESAARLANAQVIASNISVAADQAASLAAAIKGGTNAGAATGPLAPVAIPAYIAALVGTVLSAFASIQSNNASAQNQIQSLRDSKASDSSRKSYFFGGPVDDYGTSSTGDFWGRFSGYNTHAGEYVTPAYQVASDPKSIDAIKVLEARRQGYTLGQGGSTSTTVDADQFGQFVSMFGAYINVLMEEGVPTYLSQREYEKGNENLTARSKAKNRGSLIS